MAGDLRHQRVRLLGGLHGQATDGHVGALVAVHVRVERLRGDAAELAVPGVQGGHEARRGAAEPAQGIEAVVAHDEDVLQGAQPSHLLDELRRGRRPR